jgi:phospholipase/lecithinase/hemolysin
VRRTGTTRRRALTATGALALGAVLTGCGGGDEATGSGDPAHSGARAATAKAEKALREKAVRDGALLLARYDLVAEAHPATAAGLAPLRAAVKEHGKALAPPRAKGAPEADAPPAAPGPVSTDPKAAVKELAAAERRRAAAHTEALLSAEPELARLLASVAAAAAAHAYLLTELAEEAAA